MFAKITQRTLTAFLTAALVTATAQSAPLPKVEVQADPAPELQKQIDDALKQLDKLVPNQPEEVKKQIEDVRNQMRQQLIQGINPPGGFGGGLILQPGFGGFGALGRAGGLGQGRMGVSLQRPTPVLVDQLKLPLNHGLVIAEVIPESPAAKAGIQKFDILLEVDGKAVSSDLITFQKDIRGLKADTEVNVSVLRKGQKETIKGMKLPEAKAEAIQPFPGIGQIPNIQVVPGVGGGFGGAAGGPGGLGGIRVQVIGNAGNGEATAVSVSNDDFTIKHTSGDLKVAIKGKRDNGKSTPSEIVIQEGDTSVRAQSMDQVPERFRPTITRLLEGVK